MKAYIGTKIILAEEMSKEEFRFRNNNLLKKDFSSNVDLPSFESQTPGYHVMYSNPDGSAYHSWSPKNVFERAYREVGEDERLLIEIHE